MPFIQQHNNDNNNVEETAIIVIIVFSVYYTSRDIPKHGNLSWTTSTTLQIIIAANAFVYTV